MRARRLAARAASLAAALAVLAGHAPAQPALTPPPDGTLGLWQLVGAGRGSQRPSPPGATGRSVLATPAVDLARTLGTRGAAGAAWLSATFTLPEATPAWLLVSADGGVTAFVDDTRVWKRQAAHPRGIAWDAVPVELPAGRHRLTLALDQAEDRWAVAARLLDRRTLTPPAGLVLEDAATPGGAGTSRTARDSERRRSELVAVGATLTWESGEERARLSLRAAGGWPSELTAPIVVTDPATGATLATITATLPGAPAEVVLPPRPCADLPASPEERRVAVEVGPLRRELSWRSSQRACELSSAAVAVSAALRAAAVNARDADPGAALRHGVMAASLERARQELVERASGAGRDAERRLTAAAAALEQALDGAAEGALLDRPGVRDLALPPFLGLGSDRLALHVPAEHGRAANRRWPLVVLLHGWGGTPRSVLRAFLDREGSTPVVPGFVLAPDAFGDLFYRGAGERAVVEAVRAVTALYPIDPDRVTVTGVSMGGTGVAHVALRYPELWAAAAPHCGYHSFFIRRDVQGLSLRPFERLAMHHLSPASWAPAGRGLGWYVAHGTRDKPLENSRVLIEALRHAQVPVRDEWPDIGHNVHDLVWQDAQGFAWLAAQRRAATPRRFTVLGDSLRYGQGRWVRIAALSRPGALGRVEVELTGEGALRLTTEGVRALTIDPPAALGAVQRVVIDGTDVALGSFPAEAHRAEGAGSPGPWHAGPLPSPGTIAGAPAPVPRRPSNDGPILDAFLEPAVFVYGTGTAATTRANREVAEALAARFGGEALLPVAPDGSPDVARFEGNRVLVGTRDDHALLRALGERLPFSVTGGTLHGLSAPVARGGVGAVFTWPDPDDPKRKLVVVTGTDAAGVWRALSLPALLPEYVVFDERLAPAAGRQVLGAAEVLAAGYFGGGWALPAAG